MKKQIKIAFGILACAVLTFIFAGVYAADKPTITMKADGEFYVGEPQTFSISTTVPEGYETVTVIGDGAISDTSAIEKLEYFEVNDGKGGNWYILPEDTAFGGSTGFPLTNATSNFRVTFKTAGEYTVKYGVKKVEGGEVIAENTLKIKVTDKSVRDVASAEELVAAINDTTVKTINITKDITTKAKTTITRDLTINGNGHKIAIDTEDNTKWGGLYVLQAYKCDVVISDITLTGGNAALLVQGSKATLKGPIDVSGNGVGGIELAVKDSAIPSLDLTDAKLKNSTEAYKLPTIWDDPVIDEDVVVYGEDGFQIVEVDAANGNKQNQYYLDIVNIADTPDNQLKEQIESDADEIAILAPDADTKISKELLNELKEGPARDVTIYAQEYKIEFNTEDMTEEFVNDFSLQIEVSEEQPFKSDVLKDVKSDMVFIDLEYSGALPKGTKLTIVAENYGYEEGDKFMLYYYNPKTDAMELIAKEVVVDEDGFATIEINHASTYILSSAELPVKSATNPNTSDMTIVIAAVLGVVAVLGFGYVTKSKLLANKK